MSIKAAVLETPEVRKACDLRVNIKSIMYLVGVEPAMAKIFSTACLCIHHSAVKNGLQLSSEPKILLVYRVSKKKKGMEGGEGEKGLYDFWFLKDS